MPPFPPREIIDTGLASLDALIALEHKKLDALKAHKTGLMQQIFPLGNALLPRLRFPGFRKGGDWAKKSIRELGSIVVGILPGSASPGEYAEGRPYIASTDLSDRRFVTSTKKKLTESDFRGVPRVADGSVLYVGSGPSAGRIAQNQHECAISPRLLAVTPHAGHHAAFVYYALARRLAQTIRPHEQMRVGKTEFESFEFAVPGLLEQQKIANILSSVDDMIEAQARKVEGLKAHKIGLTQALSADASPDESKTRPAP